MALYLYSPFRETANIEDGSKFCAGTCVHVHSEHVCMARDTGEYSEWPESSYCVHE